MKFIKKAVGSFFYTVSLYIDDIAYFAGLGLLSYGAYTIRPPIGFICAGIGTIVFSLLIAKR